LATLSNVRDFEQQAILGTLAKSHDIRAKQYPVHRFQRGDITHLYYTETSTLQLNETGDKIEDVKFAE